jgi:hypothetical protein
VKSILTLLILITATVCIQIVDETQAQDKPQIQITEKHLKAAANNSLWRLKHSIEKDGFYSARVALNVWRSNAVDAGVFDQAEYDGYKLQIYEKSIRSNLQCYERSLQNENMTDARICLFTWKDHTQELGIFDPDRYEKMEKKLKKATLVK